MEPCQQAAPIAKLEATTEQISHSLEKLGNVLEKIAEQGTRVGAMEHDIDTLYERVRGIEIEAAKSQIKIGFIVSGIAAIVSMLTGYAAQFFNK